MTWHKKTSPETHAAHVVTGLPKNKTAVRIAGVATRLSGAMLTQTHCLHSLSVLLVTKQWSAFRIHGMAVRWLSDFLRTETALQSTVDQLRMLISFSRHLPLIILKDDEVPLTPSAFLAWQREEMLEALDNLTALIVAEAANGTDWHVVDSNDWEFLAAVRDALGLPPRNKVPVQVELFNLTP